MQDTSCLSYQQILQKSPRGLSEKEVSKILQQALESLLPLHQQGKCHANITLDNIFFREEEGLVSLGEPANLPPGWTRANDLETLAECMITLLTKQAWHPNWLDDCVITDQFADILNRAISHQNYSGSSTYSNAAQMLRALGIEVPSIGFSMGGFYQNQLTFASLSQQWCLWWAKPRFKTIFIASTLGLVGLFSLLVLSRSKDSSVTTSEYPETSVSSDFSNGSGIVTPENELTVNQPEPTISTEVNPFTSQSFPQASCGDTLPTDSSDYPVTFYPIFVTDSSANKETVKARFCQDALVVKRKDSQKSSVQVASFLSYERANQFREFISSNISGAEVGQSTIWVDASSSTDSTELASERISFNPGSTGTLITGNIPANRYRSYFLSSSQGQRVKLNIQSGSIRVKLISPSSESLSELAPGSSEIDVSLPETGDYVLQVSSIDSDQTYAFQVDVF